MLVRCILVLAALRCAVAAACEDAKVNWVWSGAMTSSSLRFRVSATLPLSCDPDLVQLYDQEEIKYNGSKQSMGASTWLLDFNAKDISTGPLQYQVRYGADQVLEAPTGTISLPPAPGTSTSFEIAFSSCADQDSDPKVFETIAKHKPLFFLHMGDLHYDNLEVNDVRAFRHAYESMFASPAGRAMLAMNLPMAYMWDDHDYGPDNSDGTAPGREASLRAYREYVPHYPLQDRPGAVAPEDLSIQQAFTIGRVRFVVTDLRSQRTPNTDPDVPTKTVLGPRQKAWFKRELLAASAPGANIGLIVWVNTMPWIDDERKWGYFTHEQKEITGFIAEHKLNTEVPIVIASGDAHMLAVDDGSIKGGPYSHGAIPGSGHFGLLAFDDDGERICVRYSGRNLHDEELIAYDTCRPVPREAYHPPPIIVRQATRAWRKFYSRALTKWLRATWMETVALLGLFVAVVGALLRRNWMHRAPKRD
ncbi:mitogen-activated protein kinase kinase [Achlya hypogyna]|uniref:Mitogen-activated protein kinase kinase n=1 Tax=Achlya hypogyna TaxID=1202772 RepID=A0A1V9ZJ74_ACHHY|nr:mitogen-activated protein kinase kinase [Achlya hypogyna]